MKIETKYELWQRVYGLHRATCRREEGPCPGCGDSDHVGKVKVAGELYMCPHCKGAGKRAFEITGWVIAMAGFVTSIEVAVCGPHPDAPEKLMAEPDYDPDYNSPMRIQYGVNYSSAPRPTTYTRFDEINLVGGTREAAQAECDRRNATAREWPVRVV